MPEYSIAEAAIINRAAFDAAFGGWSSFHDQLLLALRFTTDGPSAPALEADFQLAGGYAEGADGCFHATSQYTVTLRFHRVARVTLSDFLLENIVGELQLASVDPAGHEGRSVAVTLEAIAGCGADLAFVCAAVEVLAVLGPYPPAA